MGVGFVTQPWIPQMQIQLIVHSLDTILLTERSILMVIIVTILISLFLAVVDWMLGAAVRSLVGS